MNPQLSEQKSINILNGAKPKYLRKTSPRTNWTRKILALLLLRLPRKRVYASVKLRVTEVSALTPGPIVEENTTDFT